MKLYLIVGPPVSVHMYGCEQGIARKLGDWGRSSMDIEVPSQIHSNGYIKQSTRREQRNLIQLNSKEI